MSELVVRWGYDKTTIDDIARRAGVAKGTIYLHWKTRDDIFAALLRRERVLLVAEVRDQAPATPGELFGGYARALLRRPLLQAVLSGDSEVLGKLARQKWRERGMLPIGPAFAAYMAALIRCGAVREDPGDHVVVVSAILYGLLFLPEGLPGEVKPSDDRVAELVADTIDRTLGTGRALSRDAADAAARATSAFLDAAEDVARDRLAISLGAKEGSS
ncbi:TetR/AcrR family transcriptional regulator [Nonomuraea maritima]|uniref:TetR/AcrR family transcriptional regulator n=1 Tax=Nonomuraea maritima TaxID=683260 RepID=UPI003720A145